jgi:hypothetical protein
MLMGSIGILGPTIGLLILKVSKSTTSELMLIIIAVVGVHAGVVGTLAATANKYDEIKIVSPKKGRII